MNIVPTELKTYLPKFNENTDSYYDESPYKPYEKNRISYKCRCKAGVIIKNNFQFKQHANTKTHHTFITHYKDNFKELDEQSDRIKELMIENGKLTNKVIHLERYKNENEREKEREKKRKELLKMKREAEESLAELDFDDDNNFHDCN